jgi:hypothetical protein
MAHYAFTDEETVVQINSNGPWGINYVNPKDDPTNVPADLFEAVVHSRAKRHRLSAFFSRALCRAPTR